MKKMIAILAAMVMVFAAAGAVLAEGPSGSILTYSVQYGMNLDQVKQQVNLPNPEVDREGTRGPVTFIELEYERVPVAGGLTADVKYLFVGDALVAIHLDMADGTSYAAVKDLVTKTYGATVPFDAAKIGNGKFAVDDDGDLKDCKEMVEAEGVTVILEQDNDGDVDVTLLDPAAAALR